MDELPPTGEAIAQQKVAGGSPRFFTWFFLYELPASVFWIYSFLQVFLLDLDSFFTELLPQSVDWIVKYKFFVLLMAIAIVWIFTKNKKIIPWFIFIAFYPLILFLWKIPKLLFKTRSWIVAIASVNLVVSFFRSVKYRFIVSVFYLSAFCLILVSNNKFLVLTSAVILFLVLTVIFISRFIQVFQPSSLYAIHSKIIGHLIGYAKKTWSPKAEVKNLTIEQMGETQMQEWANNLQLSVAVNRFCLFLSAKIIQYQKSRVQIFFDVLNLLLLTLVMTLSFAIINFALYKINPHFYSYSETPNLFLFLYYSLSALYGNIIPEIAAVSNYARGLFMLEMLFSFVLVGLLFTLFLSTKGEKDSSKMENAVKRLKEQGVEMENFISSEYKLSIEQAISILEKVKASSVNLIYYFSDHIPK